MGDAGEARHHDATRRLRARRPARRRGDDHARLVSITADVVLYHAPGCHLCERARDTLLRLRDDLGFELREVDISADAELEGRYRELIPVVEIGGKQAFTYYVHEDAFRRKLAAQSAG